MLIFGKRFFLSGLAILLSLDSVGRALPAINNLKKRWAVPTLRKKREKAGDTGFQPVGLHWPDAGATIQKAPPGPPPWGAWL